MPLGIGRYSEHVKISTDYDEDGGEGEGEGDEDAPCLVRYIGQQNIPLFNSRDISGVMYSIYNKHYSPLNSLINVKKYELHVDVTGIKVYANNSKKGMVPQNLFHTYLLSDILLVSTDYQHDRLFAIIFYGSLRNCMIHLYLCNSEDDVRSLLNKCHEDFSTSRDIKLIEKSQYSDGLEIIHYKPYEKNNCPPGVGGVAEPQQNNGALQESWKENANTVSSTNCTQQQQQQQMQTNGENSSCRKENDPSGGGICDIRNFKIPYTNEQTKENIKTDSDTTTNNSFNFGDFQTAGSTTSTTSATDIILSIPSSPQQQQSSSSSSSSSQQATAVSEPKNLLDDDDFEDEFAELALKRNIYVPDHLQDRSIESVLLVQESGGELTQREESMKPTGFFSSYNKLQ